MGRAIAFSDADNEYQTTQNPLRLSGGALFARNRQWLQNPLGVILSLASGVQRSPNRSARWSLSEKKLLCLQAYRVQALACVFAQAQPKGCTLYACIHGDRSFADSLGGDA